MKKPAVENQIPQSQDIDADVEMAIMICNGDLRAALRVTLVANAFLDAELERVMRMVSTGYGRGRVPRATACKAGGSKRRGTAGSKGGSD